MSSTRGRVGLLGQHSRPHQPIAVKGSAVFAEGQRLASPHLCDSGPQGKSDEAMRRRRLRAAWTWHLAIRLLR